MVAGFDLKEGKYDPSLKSSKEIKEVLIHFLENKSRKSSTYKYAMFKSIMDCLKLATNKTYRISFDLLFSRFAEIYWTLVFIHKIPQKAPSLTASETMAEQVISKIVEKYSIRNKTLYAEINDGIRCELVYLMKEKCSRYVFGALYAETDQMLYSFSKENEWIKVNPQVVNFLEKHENTIQKLNYQAWGNYYNEIGAKSGKDGGYYRRLLKREFGGNTVLPVTQLTTAQKATIRTSKVDNSNEVLAAKRIRTMLSQYPDLGLYLAQICDKLNLNRDKAKSILENASWCKKEGSRYYYVNIYDSDLFEDALFQEENNGDSDVEEIIQESDFKTAPEYIELLSDPEELIKKLKRDRGLIKKTGPGQIQETSNAEKEKGSRTKIPSKRSKLKEWEREEVVILVTDYFRTKNMPLFEIVNSQEQISKFLQIRKEIITGSSIDSAFRNVASICKQYSKIRCIDPDTKYSKMQGTKLQREVVKEYIENPAKLKKEAVEIFKRYNWRSEN